MTYLNDKIKGFAEWAQKRNEECNTKFIVLDPSLFKVYQMENSGIPDLTEREVEYLKHLFEATIINQGLINNYKPEMVKFILMNRFGWSDKAKVEQTKTREYVFLDATGLNTANTSALNHIGESLENDAIKELEAKS